MNYLFLKAKWILTGIAAIGSALLFGWVKYLGHQRDKAELKAEAEKSRADSMEEKVKQVRETHQAVREVEQEAIKNEAIITEQKHSGVPPTGDFGDPRLRDRTRKD